MVKALECVQRLVVAGQLPVIGDGTDAHEAGDGRMQDGQHVRGAGAQQGVILAAQQGLVHGIEPVLAGMAHHFGMEHALRQQDGRAQAAVRGGARVAFAPGRPGLQVAAEDALQAAAARRSHPPVGLRTGCGHLLLRQSGLGAPGTDHSQRHRTGELPLFPRRPRRNADALRAGGSGGAWSCGAL